MAHHAHALREEGATTAEVESVCRDPLRAGSSARERALLAYTARLTALAEPMTESDLAPLRAAALADDDIRDLAQVVAYFAYVNRHVDGLGVALEPGHPGRDFASLALRREADAAPPAPGSTRRRARWARHAPFLRRAARVSLVVGTCLVALNQGDVLVAAVLHGVLPPPLLAWKVPLTYLVPFLVSWHASAAATRAR